MRSIDYKRLFQYFLQGILILAPISITIWAIAAAFNFIDGILPNLVHALFPSSMEDSEGHLRRIPGLGFIIIPAFPAVIKKPHNNLFFDGHKNPSNKNANYKSITVQLKKVI